MIKKTRIIPAVEGWIPYSYWVDDQYGYVTRSTTVTAVIPTAPDTPEIVTPAVNDSYGGAVPSFVPIVKARDANGDVLTVAYYVDGETTPRQTRTISNTATAQSVSFDTLNISNLSAGKHTFRVTVRDQLHLAERTVDFYIDQSPPTLGTVAATSTASSVTLNGSATDTPAGLASMPYRYTIGGVASAWTTQTSSTRTSLAANTLYSVLFEARDKLEHTSSKSLTLYTRAETPTVSVAATAETTATIKLNDGNPAVTQYQLKAGAKYVDASGQLVNAPTWIKPTNKQVTLNGLSPNAGYSIQAMAKNEEGHATAWSGAVTATTKATPPSSITSTMNQSSIQVSWAPTSGATGYDIEVDGTVVNNGVATSYSHTGLQPDTRHTYRIRVKNAGGTGEWSQVFTVFTWPNPPTTPTNLAGSAVQTVTTLIWDAAARAESYEIEADGKIVPVGNVLTFNHTGLQPETDHTYRIRAKNRGGLSGWSQPFTIKTLPYPPETPPNLRADLSIYSVAVAWDAPERAVAYEIEVDGLILENGESTTYLHEGLEPLSGHTYRVRAKNAGGKSEWTEPLDVTTHPEKPIAPSNILTMSDASSVTLMWYNVPNADLYEIEIDGKAGGSVTEPQFVHSGLPANSKHSYRIRAKNISGYSPWSVPVTMGTLPAGEGASEALTNVVAVVTNSFISVSWDTVAPNATYEIEVDGQIHDIDSDTVYHHGGLKPFEFHTYKIRLKNGNGGANDWVAVLSLSTLPNPPDAPSALEANSQNTAIELRWEKVEGATGYELEVDGKVIDVGTDRDYVHEPLEPGTSYTYRFRAKNETGVTAWSPAITQSTTTPTYKVNAVNGTTFELSLLAFNVQDFSEMTYVVTYDSSKIEVVDLYAFTPRADKAASGKIAGSTLNATYEPGRITYRSDLNVVPGTSWSGELATIVFRSKMTGETSVDVVVE